MPRTKQNNLAQDVFDFYPEMEGKWPEGYTKYLGHTTFYKDGILGFDCETKGLNPYDKKVMILSIGFSGRKGYAQAVYCKHGLDSDDLLELERILSNPNIVLVGHNIKYDVTWVAVKYGIEIKCMLFDTMFAQYLLDENLKPNDLENAIKRAYWESHCNNKSEDWIDLREYKAEMDRENIERQHPNDLLLYQCRDADASRRLYNYFVPKLKEGGYEKLMATSSMVLPVLAKMEVRGINIDKVWAGKTQTKLFNDLVQLRYSMVEMVGHSFDPDSYQSLGNVLYKTMGFQATKFTKTGAPSTDGEAISYLVDQATNDKSNKFIDAILQYKKKIKLLTTYYQPIERWTRYDGRRHTTYSLGRFENEEGKGGTVTGRLTSDMQQIPRDKEVRGMFIPTPGYIFLDGDFSQLELRVAAFLSQEPAMIEAFLNNLDIHSAVMSNLTGMNYDEIEQGRHTNEKIKNDRVAIKRVNFGILYGVQARRLQRLLRIELGIQQELEYCKSIIRQWLSRYSKVAEWINLQKLNAVGYGWVGMPLGQKRRLPEASFEHTKEAAHALSQASNFPVQSMASWICLIGLRLLDDYFISHNIDGHIVMQVHDSVTAEINTSNLISIESIKVDVKKIMEVETLNYLRDVFGVNFNVPLVFDIEIKERWS